MATDRLTSRRRMLGAAALLCCITIVAYFPSLRGGFIWDDDHFLTKNSLIKAPDGLYRFWFTSEPDDYWPMTSTTLWLEWRLWGMNAAGYHATNLALHGVEALLLWAILRKLRIPGAYLAALLFAVHPVNVDSVAWITQRKNLMAMAFYLTAILGFIKAGADSDPPTGRPERSGTGPWYWFSLLAFALGMLSKGSVAMLPVILLGIVAWRRRLVLRDFSRIIPFFLIAAVLVAVNILFQHHILKEVTRAAGFWERLIGAGAILWFYLYKALLPINLAFIYPLWSIRTGELLWWMPLLAAVGFTALLWRSRRSWSRPMLFAWGYFCVSLVPVMGFTDVLFMKYSLVANHYQHLAIIGIVVLAAAGYEKLRSRPVIEGARFGGQGLRRRSPQIVAAAVVCILAVLTWRQCRLYSDLETLYRATLERNPSCWMVHVNLGNILVQSNRRPEAIIQYEEAIRLKPDNAATHANLGIAFLDEHRTSEAVVQFKQALRIDPTNGRFHYHLGLALRDSGRAEEAKEELETARRLNANKVGSSGTP